MKKMILISIIMTFTAAVSQSNACEGCLIPSLKREELGIEKIEKSLNDLHEKHAFLTLKQASIQEQIPESQQNSTERSNAAIVRFATQLTLKNTSILKDDGKFQDLSELLNKENAEIEERLAAEARDHLQARQPGKSPTRTRSELLVELQEQINVIRTLIYYPNTSLDSALNTKTKDEHFEKIRIDIRKKLLKIHQLRIKVNMTPRLIATLYRLSGRNDNLITIITPVENFNGGNKCSIRFNSEFKIIASSCQLRAN